MNYLMRLLEVQLFGGIRDKISLGDNGSNVLSKAFLMISLFIYDSDNKLSKPSCSVTNDLISLENRSIEVIRTSEFRFTEARIAADRTPLFVAV